MITAIFIIGLAQTASGAVGAWLLMRALMVLRDVYLEAKASAAERERRRQAEATGALYDAMEVREAKFVLAMLETEPACYPCRDAVERGRQRLRDRLRVSPASASGTYD